ncbi:ATP-binding protein [Thalassobaculum sp.]|uniref:sensor histidine kinase n=1 Tax=Thalassobaculum sp. TaxID=2022740 RepID=UPI0032EADFC5
MINLLTNAIKFSPNDSVVTVEVIQGSDNQISISVTDRGVGIPAEKMATLGSPFTQVHGPYINKEQGAGLGLAISKSLLEAMGGMIDFHSVEGQGTCVTVTLQAAGPNYAGGPSL